ncbi:MAG: helix-turn-helix domain-containing protein [Eubacterium sp.]
MTQHEAIIRYIDKYGSITPMEAFADLGIAKLATRISEMKKDGYEFHTETVQTKTRLGKKTHYSRYSRI